MKEGAGHPVLLFDGVCNLCNGYVDYVVRHDPEAVFRLAPLQSDVADEVVADCEREIDTDALEGFVLVEPDGSCYEKSTAVLRTLARLDTPLRHTKHLLYVPRFLRDLVYGAVARSRYTIFGRRETCRLPTEDEADRFLDDPSRSPAED